MPDSGWAWQASEGAPPSRVRAVPQCAGLCTLPRSALQPPTEVLLSLVLDNSVGKVTGPRPQLPRDRARIGVQGIAGVLSSPLLPRT